MSAPNLNLRDLPPYAQLLVPVLKRLAKGHSECWSSNETLARAVGCCVKTVRNALAWLEAANLVQRVRDYTLRSRRRIRLLWVAPTDSFAFMAANTCAQSAPEFAASSTVPPDPPIEVPDGETLRSDCGPACAEPPPQEVARLVAKARKILPPDPGLASRIQGLLRRWAMPWLDAALDRLGVALRRIRIDSPMGYLIATLRGFAAEGGPPARAGLTAETDDPAERQAAHQDFIARFEAMLAAQAAGVSP